MLVKPILYLFVELLSSILFLYQLDILIGGFAVTLISSVIFSPSINVVGIVLAENLGASDQSNYR